MQGMNFGQMPQFVTSQGCYDADGLMPAGELPALVPIASLCCLRSRGEQLMGTKGSEKKRICGSVE